MTVLDDIKDVIDLEINSLNDLKKVIGDEYKLAVELIQKSTGKLIISGMGKSGIVARKIAATFSSTGTSAVFLHPSEALHGDLGMVSQKDTVILLGKSGESDEILGMLPALKKMNCKLIAITANRESTLAENSDIVLYTPIAKEACSLNLAPTCSTTAALVVGDALAIALMKKRNFSRQDFALFHPSGRLGKRLLLKVDDLMKGGSENPVTNLNDRFKDVINAITKGRVNAVSVIDDDGFFQGLITGYDIRRALLRDTDIKQMTAKEIMTSAPVTIKSGTYAVEALSLMKNSHKPLNLLPVLNSKNVVGIVTMQDMVRAGL